MATTTYANLRINLTKLLNVYRAGTCTTIGAAAGASLISTDLQKYDGASDDHYNGQWIRIIGSADTPSSTTIGNERFIADYATATGTITPRPAFAAQVPADATFEIYPWEPNLILDAVQRACDQSYPKPIAGRKGLFKTIFEEMVTNSWLWNSHFEDWTATTIPDHCALSGTATVSEVTTASLIRGIKGSSSMKMTGGGAADYVYQSNIENPSLLDLESQTVTFVSWTHAAAASKARLTIAYKIASSSDWTTASSSYHTGNSYYELLSVEATLPQNIVAIQFRWESGAGTVYFDNSYIWNVPTLHRYHLSKDFVHDPMAVEYQKNDGDTYGADMVSGGEVWELLSHGSWHIEDDGTDRMLVLRDGISVSRRKLRVTVNETLTVPTTDASTVEVSGDQMRALVALAAAELMLSIEGSAVAPDSAIIDYKGRAAQWRMEGERLLSLYGRPMPMNHVRIR